MYQLVCCLNRYTFCLVFSGEFSSNRSVFLTVMNYVPSVLSDVYICVSIYIYCCTSFVINNKLI